MRPTQNQLGSFALGWTIFAVALIGSADARQNEDATARIREILKTRPGQVGVDIDTPTDPKAIAACTREYLPPSQSGNKGGAVLIRDGRGRMLRRFVDSSGNKSVNEWCYYRDGFEVYRDIDDNDDMIVDRTLWMNSAGSRAARVRGNRVLSWIRLSPHEATLEFTSALVNQDLERIRSVLVTPEELAELGLPESLVSQIRAERESLTKQVQGLIETIKKPEYGWTTSTSWLRFDADMPHSISQDVSGSLKEDIQLFENATIFAANPGDDPGQISRAAYLIVPELIKVGDVWKLVTLPVATNPDPSRVESISPYDGVRAWLYRASAETNLASRVSPELEEALRELAEFDREAAKVFERDDMEGLAKYHFERVQKLSKVVQVAGPAERDEFSRDIINSLAAAYSTGKYNPAKTTLQDIIDEKGPLASYAAFSLIMAEYSLGSRNPEGAAEAQRAWLQKLEAFIKENPSAPELPEAMLQLASTYEFSGDEEKALTLFRRLATEHSGTTIGQSGAGAARRLSLTGKRIELSGPDLNGNLIDVGSYQGKYLLVIFGNLDATREMPDLAALANNRKADLAVIGVSLDPNRTIATTHAEEVSWPLIFEPEETVVRLAESYGIVSMPTIFLVNPRGIVVERDVRSVSTVQDYLDGEATQR